MASNPSSPARALPGIIGKAVARVDAEDKVRGRARYVDDLDIPDCWHGFLVRSPVSHGKIRSLRLDPSYDWSRVAVVLPVVSPVTGSYAPGVVFVSVTVCPNNASSRCAAAASGA